ncbi:MAG: hypothetical protein Q8M83_01060, partial [bacterium]|nr:hypothetical protein [bacterium]
MKRIIILLYFFLFLGLFKIPFAHASNSLNIYFFYGDGCPHCVKEEVFLQMLKQEHPNLEIRSFEIYHNFNNISLLQKTAEALRINVEGIPLLIVGDKHFIGYNDSITPREIKNKVNECLNTVCPDSVAKILDINAEKQNVGQEKQNMASPNVSKNDNQTKNKEKFIEFPILGSINIFRFSLPIITIMMGALDGFNPCAMWALLFLISLLLTLENKKRMWILGTMFITTSATIYFIFISAWLNLILFLGFVVWVRIIIGILALLAGGYSIKKFLFNKDEGCAVGGDGRRQKIFQKLRLAIAQNNLWISMGGIILLAFIINLVELICSAGLPAIYT